MKNKFKIRTVVRKDKQKENGLVPIYFLVDLNGKVMKLSTGNWINLKDWDARRCEPKGNYANLRTKLRRDLTKIEDFYFDKIGRDEVVTAEMIKRFYKGGDENDFFAYYERFLELKRRTERESTVKSYTGTLNHLKKFRSNILINEIDLNFIKDLDYYFRVDANLANGGAWARHKNVKSVINKLVRDGLLKESPYGPDKFVVKRPEQKTTYLDEEEIERIVKLRPRLSDKMKVNADRFLFSCYTGFRYSDMVSVRWSDVKSNGTITKRMVKTNKDVVVPITPIVEQILERYKGKRNDLIFPKISNDKINKAVRVICKLARIEKKVSFHVARHSFGYILGKNGVNAFKIMELMGHSSVKQTMRYVKACVEDLSNAMNRISLFKKAS